MGLLAAAFAYSVVLGLLVFALRRLLFSATALAAYFMGGRSGPVSENLPSVALLLAARDEEPSIGSTLEGITRLDYPEDKLQVLMIDDCSRDRTPEIMRTYARSLPNFRYLRAASHNLGKAAALNEGLRACCGEIVYVLDADSIPEPGCLQAAVRHFADGRVGAVSGAPFPSRNCSTFASYYAYLETIVHRSITTRAKDFLGLAPGIFGSNCAYRRSALEKIGGFKPGAFLEDTDLVLALYHAGYRIRFEPEAISRMALPRTISSYFRQHTRWTRGFNDVLGRRGLAILYRKHLSLPLRIELGIFSSGYLDRMFTLAGTVMVVSDLLLGSVFAFPRWALAASFLSPALTIMAALLVCREPLGRHWRLPLIPVFFAVDVIATLKGMVDSMANRPRRWHRVERELGA